jgi:hypothetical protein
LSDGEPTEALAFLREAAALGCLLNAIAHDLNNQLTNLLLGADQALYTGSKDAIELMVKQAQRINDLTRAVQALGQRNMSDGAGQVALGAVIDELAAWEGDVQLGAVAADVAVGGKRDQLVLAFSLLARFGRDRVGGPLQVSVEVKEVPRSSWSGNTEQVEMAVVRLARGTPPDTPNESIPSLIDDFFGSPRTVEEVGVMAAWEILRKLRGRPSARLAVYGPDDAGTAVVLTLPLAE